MKLQFVVTVEMPKGVTVAEMRGYIGDAVSVWCGGKDPESAIYKLDPDSVTVRPVPQPAKTPAKAK